MDKERSSSQPVDAVQYKLGMRTLAAAVNIITSAHSGHRYGMTATAVEKGGAISRSPKNLCLFASGTDGAPAAGGG